MMWKPVPLAITWYGLFSLCCLCSELMFACYLDTKGNPMSAVAEYRTCAEPVGTSTCVWQCLYWQGGH